MQRDHNRPKTLDEAGRALNKLSKSMNTRLSKKMVTFPDGEFVLAVRCTKKDKRTGTSKEHVRVVGKGALFDGFKRLENQLFEYVGDDVSGNGDASLTTEIQQYAVMPELAEKRAANLRKMLQKLWILEGKAPTKQIYKAAARNGGFEWWDEECEGLEFKNNVVDDATSSRTLYPIIFQKLNAYVPAEEEPQPPPPEEHPLEEPVELCTRSDRCDKPNGHVGNCNKKRVLPDGIMDADEAREHDMLANGATYGDCQKSIFCSNKNGHRGLCNQNRKVHVGPTIREVIESKCHPDELFNSLTAGEVAVLKRHLEDGIDRAKAYTLLGKGVTDEYDAWMESEGMDVWDEIEEQFPTYLEELSAVEIPAPRPVVRRKKKTARKPVQKPRADHKRKNMTKMRRSALHFKNLLRLQ